MPRKYVERVTKPAQFFTTQADLDEIYELAKKNLPMKALADWFKCSYQTLSTNEIVMPIVRRGWAEYRERIETEMFNLATLDLKAVDPDRFETYASMKQKALNTLHNTLHKDPYIPPQEIERVRRLSDDELKVELEKAMTTMGSKIATKRGLKVNDV